MSAKNPVGDNEKATTVVADDCEETLKSADRNPAARLQNNRTGRPGGAPPSPMLYAECGDRLTDAGADRAKARALAAQPNLAGVGKAVDVALHRHFSTISRPASVIHTRVSSIARSPAPMRSGCAVANPARISSSNCPTVKPCASMIVSVQPSGQEAMSSSAKKSLVKIGEPSHTRRFASDRGESKARRDGKAASFYLLSSQGCRGMG
jgi:hypothetical protein